jgi:hypothetical protein
MKELEVGRLAADAATALAPPSGVKPQERLEQSRSSTSAVDWEAGLRLFFDCTSALQFLADGVRMGAFPVTDEGSMSWSDWVALGIRQCAPPAPQADAHPSSEPSHE